MDARKFIEEIIRMCKSYDNMCTGCPLMNNNCFINDFDVDAEEVVATIEKWSREHPVMTNGRKLSDILGGNVRYGTRQNARKPYVELGIDADWWDAPYEE